MKIFKKYSFIICIILLHLLSIILLKNVLYPVHFIPQNFFILELIGKAVDMQYVLLLLLDMGNIFLLWLISKHVFPNRFSLIPSIIYILSPWSSYLIIAGSFYIYLSFLLLIAFYGLLLVRIGKKFLGLVLMVVSMAATLYSSFLLFLLLPIILILLIKIKLFSFKDLKYLFALLLLFILPLLFLIYVNKQDIKNIVNNDIRVFSDPGLINMVNSYQGAAKETGFGSLAKISENKYLFFTEYLFLKYIKSFIPATIFTSQEKLLGFSFTPPIYLGFLIPFAFGFYQILKLSNLRKPLLLSTLLVIPSVLSKPMVDLNRLFIFAPVIMFMVAFGLILLFEQKKKKRIAIFLVITIFLVILQFLVTISDIQLREKDRFVKYYGQNYEIGRQ